MSDPTPEAADQRAAEQRAAEQRAALYVPFVAVRGRRVAFSGAVAVVAVFCVIAVILPGSSSYPVVAADRLGLVGVGLGTGWLLWRFGRLSATPTPAGLQVSNLITTRSLEWAQIVAVQFRDGDPWASLDLSDGQTLAVMAIQRADGAAGRAQATRLATLVALHSRTPRDD